jgi:arylsulfate sulfotransferase
LLVYCPKKRLGAGGIAAHYRYAAFWEDGKVKNFKTLGALLAFAAIAAGPASTQVRCPVPAAKVALPPTKAADTGENLMMTSFFSTQKTKGCAALTNLAGVPSWSYCVNGAHMFLTRAVPGGTVLLINNTSFTDYSVSEMNLAGTTLNSITEAAANLQLAALDQQSIIDFNHEAMRLPNGYTAIIAHNEALYTNAQGGTPQHPVDVMGDEVLVLDTQWNIVWTWNAFNCPNCATELPVTRAAPLGETCHPCANTQTGDCCPVTLASQANDWLHGNSLAYDSTDGNLILSLRNQDMIVKINYDNGAGNGSLIWTMGNGVGNFTMLNTPGIPLPWFSHQHDVEVWTNKSPKQLTLFDNGNTRRATNPSADSRGQALVINETPGAMTVDIHTNVDFTFYASGYGTSQILPNGNYWWQGGAAPGPDNTRSFEYYPSGYTGGTVYAIQFADTAYRSFRLNPASGF